MGKRRASIDPAQLGFTFEPPSRVAEEAGLAGLDRVIAAKVALALKEDGRSRFVIAGAMSALLDEEVSKPMLDAYAAEARDQHNISAARLLALIAVTERFDLLDRLVRRIGAALLVGEELRTARLGHLRAQQRALQSEIRKLEGHVAPIARGERGTS
ncbi:hypothetical protein [uncultured Sphingomonas sp.]|uniref:hypothetical protein n=1 Tax=uncultured Sphingomonas sp. TaxID=158754 RepID=UPI0025842918|nr:hypothetical protein [uncultured Sphingomonas sp.]